MRSRQRRQAGLHALTAILSAAGGASREHIIANLAKHDHTLAQSLGFDVPRSAVLPNERTGKRERAMESASRPSFADLMGLDNQSLVVLM